MKFRSRLSQRIILSVVLLTAILSGLFAAGLIATIHFVENSLVSNELRKDFDRVFEDYQRGRELRLDEGSTFFPAGPSLPDYLRSIPTGYTEIVLDDPERAYYVYHLAEGETSYFLVKDQTSFEKAEILLENAVFGGFVLCVLVSLLLGRFMVRQVIAPVRKLTRQVSARGALKEAQFPLAPEYADDEVGDLAEAFDATFARLQQALHREALFTSDVSHELRTPLMVIQSTCELLLARNEPDNYTRRKIESIQGAVSEMKGLVEAFLALARGKDHHSEKATLDAIVREELPNWKRMAEKKENRLVLQGEEQPSSRREIGYPAVLLRTVIDNLVRNAIHHTSRGEIVLVLKADGFELRDNGSGIAAEEISKVFQPYYRGTESHRHGLGLGLSLVQRICEREQWTVALEQNRPSGCLFKVNLE
jgi:signal transduction histidine kinase